MVCVKVIIGLKSMKISNFVLQDTQATAIACLSYMQRSGAHPFPVEKVIAE